jgi:RNA polymerase sigma factor (sigma-70 family)
MTKATTTTTVLAHIRRWLNRARPDVSPDADLLRRFVREGDDAAFAALMDRHGPMVLGTARRVVGDYHLAEDVFQATFLMLTRQAGRLRRPAALPAWLHQTAWNLAVTALRARTRRDRVESEARIHETGNPLDDLASREQCAILDEELGRLPEKYRLPLVLCCLEGRSQGEAAAFLGWTPGSLKGRLERGRRRLRDRLSRRGLTFAVGAAMLPLLARPILAEPLRRTVLQATHEGGSVSPLVSALVNEASKPLFLASWKTILVVAVLGLAGAGAGVAALSGRPKQTTTPAAAANDKPAAPRAEDLADQLPKGAVARLGSTRLRIGNAAFALTPDGRAIVTVTPQGVVRKFDAKSGRLLEHRQLTDRSDVDPVGQFYAQLSEDGRIAAINEEGGSGRRVSVWDIASSGRIFRRTSNKERSTGSFELSPDGKRLAVIEYSGGDRKQLLRIFDVRTGGTRELGSLEFNIRDIRFSADGKLIVVSQTSAERNGGSTFVCFEVTTGKQLWKAPSKGGTFAVSPDGSAVVSATFDKEKGVGFHIVEVDLHSGKTSASFTQDYAAHLNIRMMIAPDNRTVVMNRFGEILLWDLRTRKEVRRFALPKKNTTSGYGPDVGAISPDSRTLVTNVGHLQRWDLTTGKPFFPAPPDDNLAGPIQELAFTPDGKEVFASSWGLTSGHWDVATGKRIALVHERYGHQLIRTHDGLRAVRIDTVGSPHQAIVSDPVAGKPLHTVLWTEPKKVDANGLRAYTLTANDKTLLIVHEEGPENARKSYVTVCDVASGRRLAHFAVPGNHPFFPKSPFSPCGRWLVLDGQVYHAGIGTKLFAPSGEPDERLVPNNWVEQGGPAWFSEDGRLMAGLLRKKGEKSAAKDALAVWELASGEMLSRYPKVGFVAQVAFAPDGRTIARLDAQGIRLDDLPTGKRLAEYAAPDVTCELLDRGCGTQTLVFAPDGRTLATGHQDGTVLLWKVPRPIEAGSPAPAEAEKEKLWLDLGSKSAAKARAAVERLIRHPDAAAALLAVKFRARATPDDAALAALIKDLDRDVFATREEASRKLRAYGAKAEPALRRLLAGSPSLEMRRRIEEILTTLAPPVLRLPLAGDRLRGVRAIEVLERIATAEARKLVRAWAEQTGDVPLAVEARLVLERLDPAVLSEE